MAGQGGLRARLKTLLAAGIRRAGPLVARPGLVDTFDGLLDAIAAHDRARLPDAVARADPPFADRAVTFAQEGEDLILARMLEGAQPGFFVDVGAHHPWRYSNTWLLYLAGWRGINIDATPGRMELFRQYRPGDISIEAFVGDPAAEIEFVMYNEPALNTGSARVANERALPDDQYRPIGTARIRPRRLADILAEHVPAGTAIGVMSIDVEGLELDVLRSNDWDRFRPAILLVEQLATDLEACLQHETTRFLQGFGYRPVAKAYNTAFFRRDEVRA